MIRQKTKHFLVTVFPVNAPDSGKWFVHIAAKFSMSNIQFNV